MRRPNQAEATKMNMRRATIDDLNTIVSFIAEEAREAEGRTQIPTDTLSRGIGVALEDSAFKYAQYWLLVDETAKAAGSGDVGDSDSKGKGTSTAAGCTSVVREWSDWNAG